MRQVLLIWLLCLVACPAGGTMLHGIDSARICWDSMQSARDNENRWSWLEKGLSYAQGKEDTVLYYELELYKFKLVFSEGDYMQAYDSLLFLERSIAKRLRQPSLMEKDSEVRKGRALAESAADSVWVELHVRSGIALTEVAMYMNSFPEAVNILTHIRNRYSRDSTDLVSARCYNGMGSIFSKAGQMEEGRRYFLKSLDNCSVCMPLDMKAVVYCNLAACHAALGDSEDALQAAMEAYRLLRESGQSGEYYVYALFYIGIAYEGLQEYGMAERQLWVALSEARSRQLAHLTLYVRSHLTRLLLSQGKLDEAEEGARENLQAAEEADNQSIQGLALVYLARIAEARRDFRMAAFWLDSAYRVDKTVTAKRNNLQLAYMERRLDQYRQEQAVAWMERQTQVVQSALRYRNLLLQVCMGGGVLLLALLFFLYRRFQNQRRMHHLIRMREDESVIIGEERIGDLQRDMSREIAGRDKELAAQALYDIRIHELIGSLSDRLRLLKRGGLTVKEKMYVSEMQQILDSYSPAGVDEFSLYFKRVDPDFWAKMESRFPELSPMERRLCALVWLKLNTKEIAALTHRAVSSVYTSKNRLKKKIGCPSDTHLYDFLHSL